MTWQDPPSAPRDLVDALIAAVDQPTLGLRVAARDAAIAGYDPDVVTAAMNQAVDEMRARDGYV